MFDTGVIDDATPRTIESSEELSLDTIFNGLVSTGDLNNEDGTYRVYAAFRDPDEDVLMVDDSKKLETWWTFEVDTS